MKKIVLLIIASIIGVSSLVEAQNNRHIKRRGAASGPYFYLRVQGGYDFKTSPNSVNTITTTTTGTSSTSHFEVNTYSYGSGIVPALSAGFMFNENTGAELQFGYLIGFSQSYNIYTGVNASDLQTIDITLKGSMMQLAPLFVVQGSASDAIKPYAKFGPVIGLSPSITTKEKAIDIISGVTTTTEDEYLYSGGWALGWRGVGGVEFIFSDLISVYAECSLLSMAYAPSKRVLTTSKINDQDQLANMTTSQKETDYVDSYDTDNSSLTPPDPDVASKALKSYFSFSSIGGQLGVKLSFGK